MKIRVLKAAAYGVLGAMYGAAGAAMTGRSGLAGAAMGAGAFVALRCASRAGAHRSIWSVPLAMGGAMMAHMLGLPEAESQMIGLGLLAVGFLSPDFAGDEDDQQGLRGVSKGLGRRISPPDAAPRG